MKSILAIFAASILCIISMPALSQDSKTTVIVPPLTPTTADSSPQTIEGNEMVCRKPKPLIGTRFPGPKICKTKRQWDAEMREEQHNVAKSEVRGCLPSGVCPQ